MRRGNKFLFGFMLTFFIVLCGIVGVVIFTHLGGDGNNVERVRTPRGSVADNVVHEQEEEHCFYLFEEPELDVRLWQRVTTFSEETGLRRYYPIIPWNVLPGETAVLSVSVTNFEGWEVDPNFAHVELFDKHFDEDNAFVSFILPDEEVSIAALYSIEVPYINFENAREMAMAFIDSRDRGDALAVASAAIMPQPGITIPMPPATQGELYFVEFNQPAIDIPDGTRLRWDWTFPPALAGLAWTSLADGGGFIDGVPTTVGGPTNFYVDIVRVYIATGEEVGGPGGGLVGRFWFRITVWPPGREPAIATVNVPDAMVGVRYEVTIETAFFPPGSEWELASPNIQEDLPPGLYLWKDPIDQSRWVIRGTPIVEALEGGHPEGTYDFTISLHQTNHDFELWVTDPVQLRIRVWEQPTIAPAVTTPATPAELFDGIANDGLASERLYNVSLEAHGPAVAATDWTWHIVSGTLPTGLGLTNPQPDSITIAGPPTVADDFPFTLRFRADPTELIGYVDMPYTITILPPPRFITERFDLPDGMCSVVRPGEEEPVETEYLATIFAENFPVIATPPAPSRPSITWNWDVASGNLPPYNPDVPVGDQLQFFPLPGDNNRAEIRGMPMTPNSAEYTFTLEIAAESDNPNINGAVIRRDFTILMWARRYLNINFGTLNPEARYFVRRATIPGTPNDIVDVNWDVTNWHDTAVADQYRLRRAVMPGTFGEIRVPLGGTQFVRWEVTEAATATSGNANSRVSIGGPVRIGEPGGWTAVPGTPNAFVEIEMPSFERAANGDPIRDANGNLRFIDGNVYIRSIDDARLPDAGWTQSSDPLVGTVGNEGDIVFVSLAQADLGRGDRHISWELVSPENSFPPGMYFDTGNSRTSFITSRPGGPTQAGTFPFILGINLPGSMRLDRPFTMVIHPVPGILIGGASGDARVSLADLVLLARHFGIDRVPIDEEAALVVHPYTSRAPTTDDVAALEVWFTNPRAHPRIGTIR